MSQFLRDPRSCSRFGNAQSNHVKEMFGLRPEQKWPADGMHARQIDGITVWVMPLAFARANGAFHRVRAICPDCNRGMSAGRLHQHVCKEAKNS
jgi:hypothetical protein